MKPSVSVTQIANLASAMRKLINAVKKRKRGFATQVVRSVLMKDNLISAMTKDVNAEINARVAFATT